MNRFALIAALLLGAVASLGHAQTDDKSKAKEKAAEKTSKAERDKIIDDFFNRTEPGQFGQRRRGGRQRGGRGGNDGSLIVGEMAPSFVLKSLDGKSETDLSQFKGKKPVILFFGSYT